MVLIMACLSSLSLTMVGSVGIVHFWIFVVMGIGSEVLCFFHSGTMQYSL